MLGSVLNRLGGDLRAAARAADRRSICSAPQAVVHLDPARRGTDQGAQLQRWKLSYAAPGVSCVG